MAIAVVWKNAGQAELFRIQVNLRAQRHNENAAGPNPPPLNKPYVDRVIENPNGSNEHGVLVDTNYIADIHSILFFDYPVNTVIRDVSDGGFPTALATQLFDKYNLPGGPDGTLYIDISDWLEEDEGSPVVTFSGELFNNIVQLNDGGFGDPPGEYLVYVTTSPPTQYFVVYSGGLDTLTLDSNWDIFIQPAIAPFVISDEDLTGDPVSLQVPGTFYSSQSAMINDGITNENVIYRRGNKYFVVDKDGPALNDPEEGWTLFTFE